MSGSADVIPIHPSEFGEWWPQIEPHLQRFEAETQTTTADIVRARCEKLEAQMWAYAPGGVVKGVGVTSVYEHARGRYLTIWIAAGELAPVLRDAAQLLEEWARSIGCVAIEVNGRKGWERVLDGYKPRAVIFEKDLRVLN